MKARVIILDRIEPDEPPGYCVHGRATCVGGCTEWLWLGHETVKVVQSGEALPLCRQCAVRLVQPGAATLICSLPDGPHE